MANIHVVADGQTIISTELAEEHFTIGRGDDNSLSLDDRSVSKYHAMLIAYGTDHKLVDFNSRNGTFLNGERITESMLKTGDQIRVGLLELRYEATAVAAKNSTRPVLSGTPRPTSQTQIYASTPPLPAPTNASPRPLLRHSGPLPTTTLPPSSAPSTIAPAPAKVESADIKASPPPAPTIFTSVPPSHPASP